MTRIPVSYTHLILEKKNKKWFLRFAFEGQAKLNDTKLEKRRILAVDLGVNTDAVCSVMTKDGTIPVSYTHLYTDSIYL